MEAPKLSVDMNKSIVFCVVFIGVCALIATGKLEADYLKFLLAWLIPGPLTMGTPKKEEEQ